MSYEFAELPETHIERMDRLQFEADQRVKLATIEADRSKYNAKQSRKTARKEILIWSVVVTAIAAVLMTFIYAIWIDVDPKSEQDYKTTEAYREEQCINAGGGWVPGKLLESYDQGMCVYPGKRVEVPVE